MATGWIDMSTISQGLMDAPLGGQSSKVPESSEQIQEESIRAAIERVSARRQALKESGHSLTGEHGAQEAQETKKPISDTAPGYCPAPLPTWSNTPPIEQLVHCVNCAGTESVLQCTGQLQDESPCRTRICLQRPDDVEASLRCLTLLSHIRNPDLATFEKAKCFWQCPRCWEGPSNYPHHIRPSTRRYNNEIDPVCKHDEGICSSMRIIVVYSSQYIQFALGYAMTLVGAWLGQGRQYHLLLLEVGDELPAKIITTDDTSDAFMDDPVCRTLLLLLLPDSGRPDALVSVSRKYVWTDIDQCIQDIMPVHVMQVLDQSCAWHVVLESNVHQYFRQANMVERMSSLITCVKSTRIESLLLTFSDLPNWTPGITSTMIPLAIIAIFIGNQTIMQGYKRIWLGSSIGPSDFNLAIVTKKKARSLLYAPFDERPFARRLGDIRTHGAQGKCSPPYEGDEPWEEDFSVPQWVLATEDFSDRPAGMTWKAWRDKQRKMIISRPSINLTSLYVGCSFCGKGHLVSNPKGGKLKTFFGATYLSVKWQ